MHPAFSLVTVVRSLTVAVALCGAALAQADELAIPGASAGGSSHPARGMTMQKVEAAYGAPTNRNPAVGNPPITRWEYPGFTVYFEHNIVLHSVIAIS